MQNNIDIRKICLYKKFRNFESPNIGKWHVFGHYDSMDVEKIDIDTQCHPLEQIYFDAHETTQSNEGDIKRHVLYAIGIGADYTEFWRKANSMPWLLVSLIHFRHPLNGTMSECVEKYNKALDMIISSFDSVVYKLYYSIDCNDVIAFWAANSFEPIMTCISQVSKDQWELLGEIFTIQSCRMDYVNIDPTEKTILPGVNIYLRDSKHAKLLFEASKIKQAFVSYKSQLDSIDSSSLHVSVVSGQDDIVLSFHSLPLSQFLLMYREPQQVSSLNAMTGILYMRKSRTAIDTMLYSSDDSENTESPLLIFNNEESHISDLLKDDERNTVYNKIKELKSALNKLDDSDKKKIIWSDPLLELLVELSNVEVSATAYDIYAQAVASQERLVDYICTLLRGEREGLSYLLDSSSKTVEFIQRYIQGWSQLSFHAMHSEWQLTQTADVNRLYLFPAKLNRVYAAFMEKGSKLLSGKNYSKTETRYFLAPKVCSDAKFVSIFRECGDVTALILGEIPADLIFSPQILLPTLMHEAAHYVGKDIRMRDFRYDCFLESCMEYILRRIIKNRENLVKHNSDNESIIVRIIKAWRSKIHADPQSYYGEQITTHIKKILNPLKLEEQNMLTTLALLSITLDKDHETDSRAQQIMAAWQNIDMESYDKLIDLNEPYNFDMFVDQLITTYREAFCDICMIEILQLECSDYLNVLSRIYRLVDPINDTQKKVISEIINYERFISVIETMWCNSDNIACFWTQAKPPRGRYVTKQDQKKVEGLFKELAQYTEKPERISFFAHAQLCSYLDRVHQKLREILGRDEKTLTLKNDLQKVYQALAGEIWNQSDSLEGINVSFDAVVNMVRTIPLT